LEVVWYQNWLLVGKGILSPPMNNYEWVQYSPPSPHTHYSTKDT
jgi:hypothetical protein